MCYELVELHLSYKSQFCHRGSEEELADVFCNLWRIGFTSLVSRNLRKYFMYSISNTPHSYCKSQHFWLIPLCMHFALVQRQSRKLYCETSPLLDWSSFHCKVQACSYTVYKCVSVKIVSSYLVSEDPNHLNKSCSISQPEI